MIVTTGNDVTGHTIAGYIGIVRGIVVRSPSIAQGFLGGLKQMVGGNIESYANVCESAPRRPLSAWCSTPRNTGQMPSSPCVRCDRVRAGRDRSAGLRHGRETSQCLTQSGRRDISHASYMFQLRKEFSDATPNCPHCGCEGVRRCPYCGSTDYKWHFALALAEGCALAFFWRRWPFGSMLDWILNRPVRPSRHAHSRIYVQELRKGL